VTPNATLSDALTPEARKTRARIVDMAERHFKRHGYAKTTIVDIANECAMSHANVYRFFRNKADLADAVASLWLEKIVTAGSAVVERGGSARNRLTALAIELYRVKKREMLRTKRVHELLSIAETNGRRSVEEYYRRMNAMLVRIIDDGKRSDEFANVDSEETAYIIHSALVKFFHPLLIEQFADRDLEPLLQSLMDLIVTGLARRA
jgi:AcrR family transcriptional regulator